MTYYSEEHPMADEMRIRRHREECGRLPDEVFYLTAEDDPMDPDQVEIINHVRETYDRNNRGREEERQRIRESVLISLLKENGIEVPDDL